MEAVWRVGVLPAGLRCSVRVAVNIAASLLWLRFFSFGPLEWLWRSLTYWKLQPLFVERTP
jgi:uncharacterized membrane protein YeiB